ncbi:MAG TPA: hypothetical protein VK541_11610 [Pedobacter sp.]|uniref:hypothetical protein n=1 Tax=Pedobacter sp. TaxID=1411316 RepID=UPI002CF20CFC|nr:hypothetical protein [Pedobacter sp.]HMI03123.1 hypothetical protein [Pedobacter sp.]
MKKVETKEQKLKRFTFDPERDKMVNLPNYLDHPFFQKKAEDSKRTMERFGLPAQILKLQIDRLKK